MKKIPTLFKRDPDDMKHVLSEVTPGCEWVLAGEGVATRKYDGTCCMFDGAEWWARREVKPGKPWPDRYQALMTDENTGKTVGWVPMADSSFAKWHAEALASNGSHSPVAGYSYELCGPKVNGNPEGFASHVLIAHELASVLYRVTSVEQAVALVKSEAAKGREGVVWHHPDGRMAKLKGRDFPS